MTCREFEQFLGGGFNDDAQAHIASCEACRALARWFDASSADAAPAIPIPDMTPARPLPSPWILAAGVFFAGAIVLAAGASELGLQGWNALDIPQRISIFAVLAVAGGAASLLLARQMFPTLARRMDPPVCVAGALAAIAAGALAVMPFEYQPEYFVRFGLGCARHGLFYSMAAAVPIWLVIRRGYFVRPGWAGAMTGLASGLVALTVLQLYCPLIESPHVLAWHMGPVVIAVLLSAAIGYLAAKRAA